MAAARKYARSFGKGVRNLFGRKKRKAQEFSNGLHICTSHLHVREFPEREANRLEQIIEPFEVVNIVQIEKNDTHVSGRCEEGGWITLELNKVRFAYPLKDILPSEGQPHFEIVGVSVNDASKLALRREFEESANGLQAYTVEERFCSVSFTDADILGGFDCIVRQAHAVIVCYNVGEDSREVEKVLEQIARVKDSEHCPVVLLGCVPKEADPTSLAESDVHFNESRPYSHHDRNTPEKVVHAIKDAIREYWHHEVLRSLPDMCVIEESVRLTPLPGKAQLRSRFAPSPDSKNISSPSVYWQRSLTEKFSNFMAV